VKGFGPAAGALLALCIARLWLMPLPSSFWLDEMGTVFVTRYGPTHWSLAQVAPQAWKSIYYSVARAAAAGFGSSEIAYRFPSVLFMGAALWLIARLAARLIHARAAWFAVFACLALGGINYEAADARPYAMGICVASAAMLSLVRWFDCANWRDGLLFVFFAALLWRVHLLFWPLYLVFVAYALARRRLHARTGLLFVVVALSLVPVGMDALALARDASAHAFAAVPTLRDFAYAIKLPLIAGCGLGAWFLGRWCRWPVDKPALLPAAVLILGWWLCTPVAFFLISRLTDSSMFVPRYLSISLPGAALAATLVASRWIPAERLQPFSLALGAGALLLLGQWRQVWPPHHNSNWRAAAFAVNQVAGPDRLPVLCPSPFLEAQPPLWRPDYHLPGFLYSHLDVYPIGGRPVLLPYPVIPIYRDSPLRFLPSDRFLIYGWKPQVQFWWGWLARAGYADWNVRRLGSFADVDALLFERPVQ
jgi:hypothetical protein